MKVLIAGANGAIGGAILQDALRHNDINQVVALTRKPLSHTHNKLRQITIPDFGDLNAVSQSTWDDIQDADVLIWAIGTYTLDTDVNFRYPIAFQEALSSKILKSNRPKKFRFILLSGAFVEPDQSRQLFFLSSQRKMKGELQTKTLDFAKGHADFWEAIIIRPGGIMFGGATVRNKLGGLIFGSSLAIRAECLAAATSKLATEGSPTAVVENAELVSIGNLCLQNVHTKGQ